MAQCCSCLRVSIFPIYWIGHPLQSLEGEEEAQARDEGEEALLDPDGGEERHRRRVEERNARCLELPWHGCEVLLKGFREEGIGRAEQAVEHKEDGDAPEGIRGEGEEELAPTVIRVNSCHRQARSLTHTLTDRLIN